MLRVLHLSDLHFRAGDPEDRDRALRALLATLSDERDAGRAPDVVLVSGDLVEQGDGAAYAVVARFCDRLREATGDLPRERLFVVPGNHDVDRAAGRRLQRTLRSVQDARSFFTVPEERVLHERKLLSYQGFLRDYFGEGRVRRSGHLLGFPAGTLGVATLCSTWFSQDDEDRDQLWLGQDLVAETARELSAASVTLALFHHPPEWLHPLERPAVMTALSSAFDIVCHGHLHSRLPAGHAGTPLQDTLVLAAGSCHRSAQHSSRAFIVHLDLAARTASVLPLHWVNGTDRWEPLADLADLHGPPTAPWVRPLVRARPPVPSAASPPRPRPPGSRPPPPSPSARTPSQSMDRPLSEPAQPDAGLRRYLSFLVNQADEQPAIFFSPTAQSSQTRLRLAPLYIELPARGEGGIVGVHGLLARHARLVLEGPPAGGKTATALHLCGQLARHALGMPSEAERYGFGRGHTPVPLLLRADRLLLPREKSETGGVPRAVGTGQRIRSGEFQTVDLPRAVEAQAATAGPEIPSGFAAAVLEAGGLLVVDGLDQTSAELQQVVLRGLATVVRTLPRARILITRSWHTPLTLPPLPSGAGFSSATLLPLRPAESTLLSDRWVQAVNAIPVGMTLEGTAAELTLIMRRAITSERYTALVQHPLLLTAMCWVSSRQSLPPQRAELFATCLNALVQNRVRPTPETVADLVDALARRSESLQAFRMAQTLNERSDPWEAVCALLEDPQSYEALRFLAGLQVRRSAEQGTRLLKAMISESGGRSDIGQRAQIIGLAAQMLDEMAPYTPDRQVARKVKDELAGLLEELSDRRQRATLQTRIAIGEGLGLAGDPRMPVDLLDPTPRALSPWVDLSAGRGLTAVGMLRYPVTCAQFWQFVVASGYVPAPEPGRKPGQPQDVREVWEERAHRQPNHPATLVGWDDAIALCRFLTQADWRYRYDLPTESEWERAVRQGVEDTRFYPWGNGMESGYCNTGRRLGRTTPVGVFPAGTAASGAGCVDLIGNVWQWCQNEYDNDPMMIDTDEHGLPDLDGLLPDGHIARGGSWNYNRTGAMRISFPGTRSEEVGVRLVRRGK